MIALLLLLAALVGCLDGRPHARSESSAPASPPIQTSPNTGQADVATQANGRRSGAVGAVPISITNDELHADPGTRRFVTKVGKTDLENPRGQYDRAGFRDGVAGWYADHVSPLIEEYGPVSLVIWNPFGNWPGQGPNGSSFTIRGWQLARQFAPELTDDWLETFDRALEFGELRVLVLYVGHLDEDDSVELGLANLEPAIELNRRYPGRLWIWFDAGSSIGPEHQHLTLLRTLQREYGIVCANEAIPAAGQTHLMPFDSVAIERFYKGGGDSLRRWDDDRGWIAGPDRLSPRLHREAGSRVHWVAWGPDVDWYRRADGTPDNEAYLEYLAGRERLGFVTWLHPAIIGRHGGQAFLRKLDERLAEQSGR